MAPNISTITPKAIRLKSPLGTYYEATAVVYTEANGEAVWTLDRPYLPASDKGIWEIYTSQQDVIKDEAGNTLVLNQKLGEIKVEEDSPATIAVETDPIASAAVKTLSDAVALLPTNDTISPLRTDITKLQSDVLSFASKDDLVKANAALATVTAAVRQLETNSSPAALKVLEDVIAAAKLDIAAIKTKQDSYEESLQKATQSIADLAVLVAKGTGTTTAATSTELKALQDKLTALDTAKAEKTALDTLDTSVKALKTALEAGATDAELAAAIKKVDDAIAVIENSLKPLIGRTLYTTLAITNAVVGDSIFIDGEGDIQFPTAPTDGGEVKVFDPWRRIKDAKNNISLGTGDRWLLADGTYDTTQLSFTDNQLLGGSLILKYSAPTKSWSVYPIYGSPVQLGGASSNTSLGGDRIATAILPLLQANQWVNWPSLLGGDASKPLSLDRIETSTGEDLSSRIEIQRGRKQVKSLKEYRDLTFVYEVHGSTVNDGGDYLVAVVLPNLPAKQWTNWPSLSGADAGKSFSLDHIQSSLGEDWTARLEINRSKQQVRSLSSYQNLQFIYEVH